MAHLLAANAILLLHLFFICLVMLGGLIVLRRPWFVVVHVPAAVWGALVEAFGWYCPLTDLENALLLRAGEEGYAGGFVAHYLLAVIYPDGLTRETQIVLAGLVMLVNVTVYGLVLKRRSGRKRRG
jgi:hypothetical protein